MIGQRAEPRTLNPITAVDAPSREVIRLIMGDLIAIDRSTHETNSALAVSWSLKDAGKRYVLHLRSGVRFSDGSPLTADDVVFTFQVYLDEALHSPQRDLLMVGGKPFAVRKLDAATVEVQLSQPYAAAERLFDSVWILPRHLLESVWRAGKLGQAWTLSADPASIAGLGPFRFKSWRPGERIVLERNPYYWKADVNGHRLPYLDEVELIVTGSDDAQVLRFLGGDLDLLTRITGRAVEAIERNAQRVRLEDRGPSTEYQLLAFNLNPPERVANAEIRAHQEWFRSAAFRRAISLAIDRAAMVKLVYHGRGAALGGHATPGNRLWFNAALQAPRRSEDGARKLLAGAGFRWDADGSLRDGAGHAVEFSILTSASNADRLQIATIIQADLKSLGIRANVVPLELRSLVDRLLNTHQFDLCLLGLGGGDADPNSEMNVWMSDGPMHVWSPGQKEPATAWEAEIDQLMRRQISELDAKSRKRLYDRVQEIVFTQAPVIPLVSPHVLAAAKQGLGNFRPAALDPYALWNVEQFFWRQPVGAPGTR